MRAITATSRTAPIGPPALSISSSHSSRKVRPKKACCDGRQSTVIITCILTPKPTSTHRVTGNLSIATSAGFLPAATMRPIWPRALIGPEFSTATIIAFRLCSLVLTCRTRSRSVVASIASIAFWTKFEMTCCNCLLWPATGGSADASSARVGRRGLEQDEVSRPAAE